MEREELIDMIDGRVHLGIKNYDLEYQERRHKQNQDAIKELSEGQEKIRNRLAFYAGGMAIAIPVAEWIIHKLLG